MPDSKYSLFCTRKHMLLGIGALGGAAILAPMVADAADGVSKLACTLTPRAETGPFFISDDAAVFDRSDIRANVDGQDIQAGIPLRLAVTVLDGMPCSPLADAQIDIWHCNALGVYSGKPSQRTSKSTWLRGYQLTDAAGVATFQTIVPGWYDGRTTHIHLRVRSPSLDIDQTVEDAGTTQLFFDQALINDISTHASPYNSRGLNTTTNAVDHVFRDETNRATLLSVTGDTVHGYVATITIGRPS